MKLGDKIKFQHRYYTVIGLKPQIYYEDNHGILSLIADVMIGSLDINDGDYLWETEGSRHMLSPYIYIHNIKDFKRARMISLKEIQND